jgi:hypothetical protein
VTLRGGDLLPFLRDTAFEWVFSPTSGLAVAVDLLRRMGPLPEDWNDGPDSAIANVAACLAPVTVIDEALGFYRLHGANKAGLADPPPWFFLHENLAKRPRRIAHVRRVLAGMGRELRVDAWDHYPFLRDWCLVASWLPLACLPRLLWTGLAHGRRTGASPHELLRRLARDAGATAAVTLGLDPIYREHRRRWRATHCAR